VQIRLNESELSLAFAMGGYKFDKGREVLNQNILSWLGQRPAPVTVTQSRQYHKNDNAHAEQKNRPTSGSVWGGGASRSCVWSGID
jgi:hypothetical protein